LSSEFDNVQSLCDLPLERRPAPQTTDPGVETQTYRFSVRHPNQESQNVVQWKTHSGLGRWIDMYSLCGQWRGHGTAPAVPLEVERRENDWERRDADWEQPYFCPSGQPMVFESLASVRSLHLVAWKLLVKAPLAPQVLPQVLPIHLQKGRLLFVLESWTLRTHSIYSPRV
jgi:hypothetical protein